MENLEKLRALKKLQIEKLKKQKELLPHLYGFPFYKWSREFFESREKILLLCAGNQISKSSTQIRKVIHWATAKELWEELWPTNPIPRQFWYLYPSKDVSTAEVETKWIPEFLPQGEMKDHPQYGWKLHYEAKKVNYLEFNTGVRVYFKHYTQDVHRLQSGSCTVSGTLIETINGFKEVQDIIVGDLVRTRKGFKPVIFTGTREAEVIDIELANGKSLTITPNHRIFTLNRGWVEASLVKEDDIGVYSPLWKLREKLNLMVNGIAEHLNLAIGTTETTTQDIIGRLVKDLQSRSIMQNIASSMDLIKSQRGLMSIIKTTMCLTMITIISFLLNILSMLGTTQIKVLRTSNTHINILEKIKSRLRLTVLRQTRLGGIRSTILNVIHAVKNLLMARELSTAISSAGPNLNLESGLRHAHTANRITKQTERKNIAQTHALQKQENPRKEKVYNIQIDDCPEYFANGLLIHNCHYIATDEELLPHLFDELMFRLSATQGYFSQAFTATRGEEEWYRAIERIGQKDEFLPQAHKLQVSRWDCLEYEEKSKHIPTPWTPENIREAEARCSTQNEIDKRINGRFVMDEGLKYPSFQKHKNVVDPYLDIIEKEQWLFYSAVDIGSGGKSGHPAAIVFLAVRPDFQKGAVFKGWKSPKGKDITSMDILEVFQQLKGKMKLVAQYYDWAASDFFQYASRLGEPFQKAEKGHEVGENTLNTLFKNKMLDIFDIEELEDLSWELSTLSVDTPKRVAKDDFIDATRYVCAKIPWDWSACGSEFSEYIKPKPKLSPEAQEIERRRGETFGVPEDQVDDIYEEIDYFNELMDV